MHLKKDFRYRLRLLDLEIQKVLSNDEKGKAELTCNLFPYLFQLYSLIWCKRSSDFLKK